MKLISYMIFLFMAACAGQNGASAPQLAATPTPQPTATPVQCVVYDSCTYRNNGLTSSPVYDCHETTLQASEHSEIAPSYFQGASCLTYREDFNTQMSFCGPMNQYTCYNEVQGPGPLALPGLGL